MTTAEAERFWAKVEKDGPVPGHCPEVGPCWLWQAGRNPNAYGSVLLHLKNGRTETRAHRAAWIFTHGRIPRGLWVLHRCDTPACVRPEHLFLGTCRDNIRDAIAKGRWTPRRRVGPKERGTLTRRQRALEWSYKRPLGEVIDHLLYTEDLTYERAAERLGISPVTLWIWRRQLGLLGERAAS